MLLNRKIYGLIAGHAGAVYPAEACGVLLGGREETGIETIRQAQNSAEEGSAEVRFCMDPLQLYRIEQEADREGKEILGFYHSHPDREAVLSEKDRNYMVPEMLYIIVSVTAEGLWDIRGYRKDGSGGIREEEVLIS